MNERIAGSGQAADTVRGATVMIGTLCAIYMVSQFLRNSIGVIAPNLATEMALSATEIGLLSSVFFLSFTAVQLPLGMALDRFGPKRCMLVCAAMALVGLGVFITGSSGSELILGRVLLGLGSASFFMGPLAIYARWFNPGLFSSLTGIQLGFGTIGTLAATAPLALATAAFGWRASFAAVAAVILVAVVLIVVAVRDAPPGAAAPARHESFRESMAGVLAVLRTPSMLPVFALHFTGYAALALLLGLWGGPYLTHIHGYGLEGRGNILLLLALAQIAGLFLWGPADRLVGSYKLPVACGALGTAGLLLVLALAGPLPIPGLIAWFAAFGLVSAFMPVLIAHGKALFPPHLVGRGITVMNTGTMGGVFVSQSVSGIVIQLFDVAPGGAYPLAAYQTVFGLQAGVLILATAYYLRARDPRREPAAV